MRVACELQDVIAGGDHVIVTGAVTELESDSGPALVFHGGGYGSMEWQEADPE